MVSLKPSSIPSPLELTSTREPQQSSLQTPATVLQLYSWGMDDFCIWGYKPRD